MSLPEAFKKRLTAELGEEASRFFESLRQPSPTSIRLHHRKGRTSFQSAGQVPWCPNGHYLQARPSFHLDPHWHGGAYYVQEASSMILDYILSQLALADQPRIWLDLCAAPGGKTGILAKHQRQGDILIANELIAQRRNILYENLIKGGCVNTFLTGLPASAFRSPLADILLIDAPCAGEGMMRKDPEAISQWNPALVESCSFLQKQIIADASACLKPNGYLIYSTCSYSRTENMLNIRHFMEHHGLQPVKLSFPDDWGIMTLEEGDATGYQLYPHRVKGEGLFIAVLQRQLSSTHPSISSKRTASPFTALPTELYEIVGTLETILCRKDSHLLEFITKEALDSAIEVILQFPRATLVSTLGVRKGKDFIPSHFLAMSGYAEHQYPTIDLDHDAALDYLERKTQSLPEVQEPGWYLIRFDTTILGWAKSTRQGWKNHYPMPWRLRKR